MFLATLNERCIRCFLHRSKVDRSKATGNVTNVDCLQFGHTFVSNVLKLVGGVAELHQADAVMFLMRDTHNVVLVSPNGKIYYWTIVSVKLSEMLPSVTAIDGSNVEHRFDLKLVP